MNDLHASVQHALASSSAAGLQLNSTGRNWGYATTAARQDGEGAQHFQMEPWCAIRNADQISIHNPVAVIEPGVTQGQLADFLRQHHPGLTFNVTGSARHTSIIGNALDRGVGYFGPRRADLFGLEVLTPSGKHFYTGFRRLGEGSPLALTHPSGLGPELDGLFFQSNMGVVLSACLRLVARKPCEKAISLALLNNARAADFIDVLQQARRDGLISSVTHIGNQARTHSSLRHGIWKSLCASGLPEDAALLQSQQVLDRWLGASWSALGSICGLPGEVRARIAELRRRVRGLAAFRVVDESTMRWAASALQLPGLRATAWARQTTALLEASRPLQRLALGEPTDAPVDNLLWMMGQGHVAAKDFSRSNCGILYVSPALPPDGELTMRLLNTLSQIARSNGHTFYCTVNIETDLSMVAIINLVFDKTKPHEREVAHTCAQQMHEAIRSQGLEVYRARDDMMDALVDVNDPYWQVVASIKQVLDPRAVLNPGRYAPR